MNDTILTSHMCWSLLKLIAFLSTIWWGIKVIWDEKTDTRKENKWKKIKEQMESASNNKKKK